MSAAAYACLALLVLFYLITGTRTWGAPRGRLAREIFPVGKAFSEGAPCEYGSLPGLWAQKSDDPSSVGTWKLFEASCQLEDLVWQHVQLANATTTARASKQGVKGILLLGDSSDRNLVYDFCKEAGVNVVPFDITSESFGPHTCNRHDSSGTYKDEVNCNTCLLPNLRVSKEAIWGLGPYADFPFPESRLGLAAERTAEALQTFTQEHGAAPDLVVFASNYWDIARMVLHQSHTLEEAAFQSQVAAWIASASEIMTSLMAYAAKHGTIIAMRTTHFPRAENCQESGRHLDVQLGEHMHVAYLNAATRQVALQHNAHLVDIEMMMSKFWTAMLYQSDNHHLKPEVNLQVMNVYLNLLRNKKDGSGPNKHRKQSRHSGY